MGETSFPSLLSCSHDAVKKMIPRQENGVWESPDPPRRVFVFFSGVSQIPIWLL
jgi:hypothetical protein